MSTWVRIGVAVVMLVGSAGQVLGQPRLDGHEPLLTQEAGSQPAVGEQISALPGEPIYSEFDYPAWSTVELSASLVHNEKIRFEKGERLYGYTAKDGLLFCSTKRVSNLSGESFYVCLADKKSKGEFDSFAVARESGGQVLYRWLKSLALTPSVPYSPTLDPAIAQVGAGDRGKSFRREVLYQGAAARVLRLLYREYVNDLARPAFSQELSFDLAESGPTVVVVKNARFEVLEAGNEGATVRVVKGFSGN